MIISILEKQYKLHDLIELKKDSNFGMIEFSFIINILHYFTAFSVFQITFSACKIFDTLLVEL